MKAWLRTVTLLALCSAFLLAVAAPTLAAPSSTDAKPLVRKLRAPNLGAVVLARGDRQALYYWNREKHGKIRCVGACAEAWPPYIVGKKRKVPKRIRGFKGKFGKVRRPDGRYQLTFKGRPLYTYAHERRGVVLCDDVDGWFAIRL